MKNTLIFLLIALGVWSCKNKELEQEVENLRLENQKLITEAVSQDSIFMEYMEGFQEIGNNLSEIRSRELSIDLAEEDGAEGDIRDKITNDIQSINELMAQNRQKIEELDKKLSNSQYSNNKLKKAIQDMKEDYLAQIEEKEGEITVLKNQLADLNYTVEELNGRVEVLVAENEVKELKLGQQEATIQMQENELNTAWYACGTTKELKEGEVISSEGGILGIGKTRQLRDDFNQELFQKIDITQTSSIPLKGKKVELLTSHPQDSYELEKSDGKTVSALKILDPDKFWQASKYLVVEVKG